MFMKKILSILITSFFIAVLAGCGSGGGSNSGGTGGNVSGTLSWSAPTTNTDGSPLADLAGYKVYYGISSGYYTGSIVLAGKDSTSVSVATLASDVPASGKYYIVVTAYDTSGIESAYSNEVAISL